MGGMVVRLAKSRNILGILLVLALAVGTSERLQAGGVETVLWQEDFEQAEAAGWTYYTSAAESSDTMTFTANNPSNSLRKSCSNECLPTPTPTEHRARAARRGRPNVGEPARRAR